MLFCAFSSFILRLHRFELSLSKLQKHCMSFSSQFQWPKKLSFLFPGTSYWSNWRIQRPQLLVVYQYNGWIKIFVAFRFHLWSFADVSLNAVHHLPVLKSKLFCCIATVDFLLNGKYCYLFGCFLHLRCDKIALAFSGKRSWKYRHIQCSFFI